MTAERKQLFLKHLSEHGIVGLAAKHATPLAKHTARQSFYAHRADDPEFATAWDQALQDAEDRVYQEMRRRGVEGFEEVVFGSQGVGMGTGEVGTKIVYSDRMLELYTKITSARATRALNSKSVEVSGTLASVDLDLKSLSPKKQELLRLLLEDDEEEKEE